MSASPDTHIAWSVEIHPCCHPPCRAIHGRSKVVDSVIQRHPRACHIRL